MCWSMDSLGESEEIMEGWKWKETDKLRSISIDRLLHFQEKMCFNLLQFIHSYRVLSLIEFKTFTNHSKKIYKKSFIESIESKFQSITKSNLK